MSLYEGDVCELVRRCDRALAGPRIESRAARHWKSVVHGRQAKRGTAEMYFAGSPNGMRVAVAWMEAQGGK